MQTFVEQPEPAFKMTARQGSSSRRTILLSIYACSPIWGSEPGVGWRWALELSLRYRVIVLTHAYFRAHIEQPEHSELIQSPGRELEFIYLQPYKFGLHPHTQLNSRVFYTWWQWCAHSIVSALCQDTRIDLIHHLTWGTYRFPVFLATKGVPLVMGPLGGGDTAPQRFYKGLPARERWRESIRAMSLSLSRLDPLVQRGLAKSALIFCKTEETMIALGPRHLSRSRVAAEIGAPEIPPDIVRDWGTDTSGHAALELSTPTAVPFRLLYAGRLIGMKGTVMLLDTVQKLVEQGRQVELMLAGDGPLRSDMESRVRSLGIEQQVKFLGMLPREDLLGLYGCADLFFFPSLHDSSGNVVLEALSRALPVLCLDLGGPKHYVTPESAVVVRTKGLQLHELVASFTQEIAILMDDRPKLLQMKRAAVRHAQAHTWASTVQAVYAQIERHFEWQQ